MKKRLFVIFWVCILLLGGCNATEPGRSVETNVISSVPTEQPDDSETEILLQTPTPSPTVIPTLTSTPTPTVSPTPTATPELTEIPVITPDPALFAGEPTYTFQMGENVQYVFYGEPKWHEEYKDGDPTLYVYVDAVDMTLVVRGTGSTKDCTNVLGVASYTVKMESPWSLMNFVSTIVIEEGITRIGDNALSYFFEAEKVYVPSTLTELGEKAFYNSVDTSGVWYGLDVSKLNAEKDSFLYCNGLQDNPEAKKYMIAPTPIPGPTAKPVPPTLTPRPDVTPIPGTYKQRQIGDNVWCRIYDNGVMHIVGSGSTWDYKSHAEAFDKLSRLEGYRLRGTTVIVEEGITRIGNFGLAYLQSARKIILPSTIEELGECAFYASGDYDGCEWIGLTPEKWKTKENSLLNGRDFDKVPEYARYCQVFVPAADPENPKLRHVMPVGDNITVEFWDNGYLYVKGSGEMKNKSDVFCVYDSYQNENPVLSEIADTITHVVVEEGITYIGNQNFLGIGEVEEVWLPSTLAKIATEQVGVCFQTGIEPKIMHCYHEGEPITIEVIYKYGRDMCYPFAILDRIKYPEKYWDSLEWYEKDELEEYRILPEKPQE